MVDPEAAPLIDVFRKIAYRLYFARWQSRNRPHLPQIDLTPEYLLKLLRQQEFRCALTGVPLTKSGPQRATIDRIVGARGYCKRNVRWVAKFANYAKGSMSDADFAGWWNEQDGEQATSNLKAGACLDECCRRPLPPPGRRRRLAGDADRQTRRRKGPDRTMAAGFTRRLYSIGSWKAVLRR